MSNLEPDPIPLGKEVSGKWVVVGMFAFAIVLTGFLWVYTKMHRAPFLPLRSALTEEFTRAASPRVEGGRPRRGPMTLRVVLNVDFDPNSTAAEVEKRVSRMTTKILGLAQKNIDLASFEVMEIFYVHLVPEGESQRREIKLDAAEIQARLARESESHRD